MLKDTFGIPVDIKVIGSQFGSTSQLGNTSMAGLVYYNTRDWYCCLLRSSGSGISSVPDNTDWLMGREADLLALRIRSWLRARPLMIWGGGENREQKISKALFQEKKNFKRPSWKKNKFQKASLRKKKNLKRPSRGKKKLKIFPLEEKKFKHFFDWVW